MITIVSYGLGNIEAILNIYRRLGIAARVACTAGDLQGSEKIILPGVGAFDWAMTLLGRSGMRDLLEELVVGQGRPVLGICVGMQILARCSEEGKLDGLGWIDAEVRKFGSGERRDVQLPHMGWNEAMPRAEDSLFQGFDGGARFYFLHSFYMATRREEDVLAETEYNGRFASAVRSGKVYGVQFHPEKSHQWGIQLLRNFAEL